MIQPALLEKLETLSEALQLKVLNYIDSLIEEQDTSPEPEKSVKKYRTAGTMKGMIVMSDDFDEPLEEMEEIIRRYSL